MGNVSVDLGPFPSEGFRVDTQTADGVCLVIPRGYLDMATAPLVEQALMQAERTPSRVIVLDLSAVTFMDSSGLHLLLQAAARSSADSERLRITRPTEQVERLLTVSDIWDGLPWLASERG